MVKKCKSGHWYDPNLFNECPHCKKDSEKLKLSLEEDEDDRTVSMMDLTLDSQLNQMAGGTSASGDSKTSDVSPNLDLNTFDFGIISSDTLSEDDDRTISFWDFGMSRIPAVTGWLVGLNGEETGKDFRLHTGKNFIGRGINMDVVLTEDKKVSRDKHCSITYDPKGNKFYVNPEQGNVVYLNKKLLENVVEIQEGDILSLGDTDLAFIPYCKEERKWEKS